jgi:hypothetical protein
MHLNNFTTYKQNNNSITTMKTKIILGLMVMFGALSFFSASALAATYQYVNTAGNIQRVEAVSAEQALAIAPNRAVHSGVMLYSNLPMTITYVNNNDSLATVSYVTYQYVNTSGQIQSVVAANPTQAFSLATNIALHSGVMRVGAYQAGV